jgi:predicted DNA-binding transcriptional regulator YafY
MFKDSYGIILGDDVNVESVWIKVDAFQANYLRSLPLHHSQLELRQNEDYSVFSVRVRPTYDFKQKILSLGSTTEVIKPESLRDEMKEEIKAMSAKYMNDEE